MPERFRIVKRRRRAAEHGRERFHPVAPKQLWPMGCVANQLAEKGKLRAKKKSRAFASLRFTKAAEKYLEERRYSLARYSIRSEQERSHNAQAYFGQKRVNRITAENPREYIDW